MKKIIFILTLCFFASNVWAEDSKEIFQKKLSNTFTEILCETNVIKDMDVTAKKYFALLNKVHGGSEKNRLMTDFSKELQEDWENQRYDLSSKKDVMAFLRYINTISMKEQAKLSKEWTNEARKQCPKITSDYSATYSATMTLISTIGADAG